MASTIEITRNYESGQLTHEIVRDIEHTFDVKIQRPSGDQLFPVYVTVREIEDRSEEEDPVLIRSYGPGSIHYSVMLESKEEAEALDAAILAKLAEMGVEARGEP